MTINQMTFQLENAVKINQEIITSPKPIISSNFLGQTAKNPNEFVWNGESTILLVNFPDDKKYVLSSGGSNSQATATAMQNFLVPISTSSSNLNAIVKKINLGTQLQPQQPPPPPPPPVSLHLTQIAAPKISSHQMNVNANKSRNVSKMAPPPPHQHQTLPSINSAVTVVNSTPPTNHQALHNSSHPHNVLLNNVSATVPFANIQPSVASVKKEYSLYDASSSSAADTSMIPNDLLLSANAMDTMSPMQQSNCEDSCNSFDLFLSEAAQSHSDIVKMHDHNDKCVTAMNVKKEPTTTMLPSMSTSVIDPCNMDLKTFDDIELMELMSQQLDMDISDDSCHPMTGIKDELIDR